MAIDFPSSPSNGTEYTYNGVTYVYNSTTDQWIVQGTGSSELYVLKTGDTMTGKLTGTAADFSGNVKTKDLTSADATVDTLTSNGAVTAAGEIRAGSTDNAKTHAFVAASGWFNAKRMDDPIDASKLLFKGENKDGVVAQISMNGTTTFGSFDETKSNLVGTRVGVFTNNSAVQTQCNSTASDTNGVYEVWKGTTRNILFTAGGTATFTGGITTGGGIWRGGSPNCGVIFYGTASGSTVAPSSGTGAARHNAVNLGDPDNKWKAVFAVNGSIQRLNLEVGADDPANYVSKMVDGEQRSVYNGPVLDVGSELQQALARIKALEEQVLNLQVQLANPGGASS